MNPEFTLDYIAENDLRGDESWEAARYLGKQLVRYMRTDGLSSNERDYYVEDDDDIEKRLFSVSEQPDLTGPLIVNFYKGEATWAASRPQGNSYKELVRSPKRSGPFLGFAVLHRDTQEPLLRTVLPLTPMSGHLLRNGYCVSYYSGASQRGIMERYNNNDLLFEPRRVQVAASVARFVIDQKLAHVDTTQMTPEEHLAFLEKYFPYQDLLLTGGGGKTVRRRHSRDPRGKGKTYTLEELQAMSGPRRKRRRDEQG